MKTTENISLGGYAFTIETDAYNELSTYINEISRSFSADPSAEEIIADIEERIAELLKEQIVTGMVVNISMVQDIKKRIGNPKELAQDEPEPIKEESPAHQEQKQKKADKRASKGRMLYRNLSGRVFGGVCSGLGTYFRIDSVLIRIIFLILFMIGLLGLDEGGFILLPTVAYICLWIAMPAARTDEQKREMTGRPTDLKGYREKNFDFEKEIEDLSQSPGSRTFVRVGGVFLGLLMLLIGIGGLLGAILIPSMPEIIGNQTSDYIMQWGSMDAESQLLADLLGDTTFWGLVLVMIGIGCVGIIYGAIMLLFDLKPPAWRPGLILFIAWIISVFSIAAYSIKVIADGLPDLFL